MMVKVRAWCCVAAAALFLVSCGRAEKKTQAFAALFSDPFSLQGTLNYEENVLAVSVLHEAERTVLTLTDGALAGCGFVLEKRDDGTEQLKAFCEDVQMPFAAQDGILQLFSALTPTAEELLPHADGFESAGGVRYTVQKDGTPRTVQCAELTLRIEAFEQAAPEGPETAAKETEYDGA